MNIWKIWDKVVTYLTTDKIGLIGYTFTIVSGTLCGLYALLIAPYVVMTHWWGLPPHTALHIMFLLLVALSAFIAVVVNE